MMTNGDAAINRKMPRLASDKIGTVVTVSLARKMKDIAQATSRAIPIFEVNSLNIDLRAQNRERRLFIVVKKVRVKVQ